MRGDIFLAGFWIENASVHGDINSRRQDLCGSDGRAQIKSRIGHAQTCGLHRARQHNRFAGNSLQRQRRLNHRVRAVRDHDMRLRISRHAFADERAICLSFMSKLSLRMMDSTA